MLFVVVMLDLELEQLDITISFLYNNIEEQIYLEQLEGSIKRGFENKVTLWTKTFSKQWYKRFYEYVLSLELSSCSFGHCVYFQKSDKNGYVYLLIYVCDILIVFKDIKDLYRLKNLLKIKVDIKNRGLLKEF